MPTKIGQTRPFTLIKIHQFGIGNCKPCSTFMQIGMKLTNDMLPQSNTKIDDIDLIPYVSVVGSLIHATICMHLEIMFAINNIAQFIQHLD